MSIQSRRKRLRSKLHFRRCRPADVLLSVRVFLCALVLAVGFLTTAGALTAATGMLEIWHGGSLAYWAISLAGLFLAFRPAFWGLIQDFRTLAREFRHSLAVTRRWQRLRGDLPSGRP